jgi:hypothetical protein
LCTLLWLVKGATSPCTCRKECNKYDLSASQYLWLAHHTDRPRWFAISSPPPICCPNFSFRDGVAKEYIIKLGCWKITFQCPILGIAGDALICYKGPALKALTLHIKLPYVLRLKLLNI